MEIRAHSVYDLKATKAAFRAGMYKKKDPRKGFRSYLILAAVTIVLAILCLLVGVNPTFVWILIGIVGVATAMLALVYFLAPVMMYRGAGPMADQRKDFTFREDEFSAKMSGELFNGESTVKYSVLFKVMETGAYFFIWLTKNQIYIVDKSTLEGGSAEQIRATISAVLGDKYIVCDY